MPGVSLNGTICVRNIDTRISLVIIIEVSPYSYVKHICQ